MSCTHEPVIQSCDSCQLAITSLDVHKDIDYQVKHRLYLPKLDTQLIMPGHYKKVMCAYQPIKAHTIVGKK